ncbi:CHIQUITA1-LIKE 4 [Hibiscus trionum]|uniref:CHIQUITA1-LIKE 4 n=1 Tax=Hibiscus trionum TaxID=183268 RepID=A0A9W7I201_HIBTR|nr:CHIQUITA1-LIKE 4 [Hibiscus trionum]
MEVVKPSAVTLSKSKEVCTLSKVFYLYAATFEIVPDVGVQKVKPKEIEEWNDSKTTTTLFQKFDSLHDEEHETRITLEALTEKIFAIVPAIKVEYAQSPYDAEGIQAID